ncbi:putative inositol(myo)-1(or 4)-monophosphatase 2 [Besnoitia besnoiti]|uniref:Inositol-1-monophosphatase n=1 Tax=Besnoitia besnoiti TaxID=94643 RepID=A0A2A9MBN7_BESBE|nr:putative inositol(myo)-1(or 4)-monophosphatase 2 [Besnoitia besnoiti]PFH35385.1 putative inositol(myo)-1(or 4)-monophosphatase 2 [Besnoitia besnoiti]
MANVNPVDAVGSLHPCTGVSVAFVESIAREAGDTVRRHFFERDKKVDTKDSPADLVTAIDKAVENQLKERIRQAFPEHQFLCEESCTLDERLTDAPTWVIDPIDGTTNFVHTLPFTCVSIAFAINKEVLVGVVYAPILNEMFTAEKGKGAWLNGERIYTSGRRDRSCAVVCCGFSVGTIRKIDMPDCDPTAKAIARDVERCVLNNFTFCSHHCRDIRHLGSTALELCYLAAGRMDAYQSLGPKEWDFAAAILIVQEAGGCVIDFNGEPLKLHKRRALAGSTEELARSFIGYLMAPGL